MLYSMFLLAVLFQNYNDVKEIIYFLYPDLRQWQPDEKVGVDLCFISTSDYVNAYGCVSEKGYRTMVYAGSKCCLSLTRWTCARPSRNHASTLGDGKCRVDALEIQTCLYNMTIT